MMKVVSNNVSAEFNHEEKIEFLNKEHQLNTILFKEKRGGLMLHHLSPSKSDTA